MAQAMADSSRAFTDLQLIDSDGSAGSLRSRNRLTAIATGTLIALPFVLALGAAGIAFAADWLDLLPAGVMAVVLMVVAIECNGWVEQSLCTRIRSRLLGPSHTALNGWLETVMDPGALVHCWTDGELGGVGMDRHGLLVVNRAGRFQPEPIAFAAVEQVQHLTWTSPVMLAVDYRTLAALHRRLYLPFPDTDSSEIWNGELRTHLRGG